MYVLYMTLSACVSGLTITAMVLFEDTVYLKVVTSFTTNWPLHYTICVSKVIVERNEMFRIGIGDNTS